MNRFATPARLFTSVFIGSLVATSSLELSAEEKQPNVVIIAVDDLRPWVGAMGFPAAKTPNIDRLASRSVTFSRAYTAAPWCQPSRTALLTGIRPSSSGVYSHWDEPWRASPALKRQPTLPQSFRHAGYEVVGAGKLFHHSASAQDPDSWERYWPSQTRCMLTLKLANPPLNPTTLSFCLQFFCRIFLATLSLSPLGALHAADTPTKKPNIVLILADDLGWSDLGCYGADLHETPHLDQLAQQGLRFTDAYAMSVCTPSRAALLTGKHSARLHMTIWSEGSLGGPKNRKLIQADSLHDLPHTETTLARHLQKAGYLTALVGKWHLGDASHYPETQGFDVNIGGTQWGAPQTFFWPYSGSGRFGPEFRYVPHLEFGKPGEYLTDRLTDEALRVIDQADGKPFFLYLAHHAPHTPIEAKADEVRYFEAKLRPGQHHQNAVYAAMVKSLDDSVGRVLDHLKQRGLEQNTIVIFTSDNGGYIGTEKGQSMTVTSNAPLRSGKGSLYEGGIRVPLIVRWPGVTPAAAECHEPAVLMDLFHTFTATLPVEESKAPADGMDLIALLQDPGKSLNRDALYFHYPHYYATTTPVSAVRSGNWKLLEYLEDGRVELYNLKDDPGEMTNLAPQMPDKAASLLKQLRHWRTQVDAAMPAPNPAFK